MTVITNKKLEKIRVMENKFNEFQNALNDVDRTLTMLENQLRSYKQIRDYYASQEWADDVKLSNLKEFPEPNDLPHGILSQDTIFDEIGHYREIAIRMLKLGTKMIEEY